MRQVRRIPYRDTWTPVPGQSERTFRVMHARPWMAHEVVRRSARREIAEAVAFLLVLVLVVAAMSVDWVA